ncbi:hypothetical protein MJD09_10650 [bacterium]|nr:hypothetical protein [bacterium]
MEARISEADFRLTLKAARRETVGDAILEIRDELKKPEKRGTFDELSSLARIIKADNKD